MKVRVTVNISANGKILLSDNPHHQLPKGAMEFYINNVTQVKNLIIGLNTFKNFQQFPDEIKKYFKDLNIIILSEKPYQAEGYNVVRSPEEAIKQLTLKGVKEVAIGGGTGTFNAFIDNNLVTDIYLNMNPLITGSGSMLGNNNDLNVKFKIAEHTFKDNSLQLHLIRK